jgi:hypothetical protein
VLVEEAEEARRRAAGASRRLGTPRAASGSRGGVDAPSVDSSFSSPSSSPLPVCGGADGDETPRRLGLGAQGGAVAAYL